MPVDIFCGFTVRFVSDLVGNPEYRFSPDAAQISLKILFIYFRCKASVKMVSKLLYLDRIMIEARAPNED